MTASNIVGVISFQKIFGLYGLERHIVEKRWGVTLVHGQRTDGRKCEDRARILKQNSQCPVQFPVKFPSKEKSGVMG